LGRKQTRAGKSLYFCATALILLMASGCGTVVQGNKVNLGRAHLDSGRRSFLEGDYGTALKESEKAASSSPNGPLGEEALFYMGLIYAHPANPNRDYGKSLTCLKRLVDGNPRSLFGEQAKVIIKALQQNEELGRTVERLNGVIKALKKVDIGIEEKKKETSQ
jgi:TPR repeat protein